MSRVLRLCLPAGQARRIDKSVTSDAFDPDHVYTSTEVGTLLRVNPSSVKKWVNVGALAAFRTPGGHRRIRAADLLAFLGRHRMPVPAGLRAGARHPVVVVDDDRVHLRALCRRLRRWSDVLDVTAVDDPLDALVRIGARRPTVVVIDVYMPRLDGFGLCRALRRCPETRDAVLITTSASMSPELSALARDAGANHALPKPLDVAILLGAVGIAATRHR